MARDDLGAKSRFTAVLQDTHGQVRAYIAGLGVPVADVDDVAQEAYLAYYGKMADLPADLLPIRWLKRTARNRAMDYFRRATRAAERRRALAETLDPGADAEGNPEDDECAFAALRKCLEALTPRTRNLIEFRYRNGLTSHATAKRTGMKAGAVRVALLRARETLRDCISAALGRAAT